MTAAAPSLPARGRGPGPGLCFGLGLLATLTLGASLGAWNLAKSDWAIGEVTGRSVLVHAHSQIFGFVLFFVVGIAGHALPRLSRRPLDRPWLLWAAVAAAAVAEVAFPAGLYGAAPRLVRLAEAADLAAALAAAATVWTGSRHLPHPLGPWLRVGSAFLVAAGAWGLAGALDARRLLEHPGYWHLCLFGFAGTFILGMAHHVFEMAGGFDVRPVAPRRLAAGWALGVALASAADAGWLPPRFELPGRLLELAVAAAVAWELGLFRPLLTTRAGAPFFASAWGWLLASLGLSAAVALGLLPDHQLVRDAARHAYTIGCVTQLIVGVALRALPAARGVKLAFPPLAWSAWALVNGSAALRLGRIVAATAWPGALWISGASGLLAVAALLAFAASLGATARRALR